MDPTFSEIQKETVDLLSFKLEHLELPLYPLIRFQILNYLLKKKYNLSEAHAKSEKNNISKWLRYIYLTIVNNVYKVRSFYDLLMFSSSRNNLLQVNGKFFDILYDYYALLFPDKTLIIERSYRNKYKHPRYFKNVLYNDSIIFKVNLKNNIGISENEHEIEARLGDYLNQVFKIFDIKDQKFVKNLFKISTKLIKKMRLYFAEYEKLFSKIRPKIIFIHTASYGSIPLIVAKRMGIPTGEFQHGIITNLHPAYNYGEKIMEHIKDYLPDYLLTYGEYWHQFIRHPAKKVAIGTPHLYSMYNKTKEHYKNLRKDKMIVLVVSQGIITKKMVELTKNLSKWLDKSYQIIFRLHPGEVPFEERYKELYDLYPKVIVNKEGDIHELLYKADYIIGHTSTALYEALIYDKKIYVYEDEYSKIVIPKDIGLHFNSDEEVYEYIKNDEKAQSNIDIESIWNPNWKENYEKFISQFI